MSAENPRVCAICGQTIPPKAKLTTSTDPNAPEMCLRCRIAQAEREKGR